MKREGRVVIAWPEDQLITGDVLTELDEKLRGYGRELGQLIPALGAAATEATIEIGENAMLTTLETLGRPIAPSDLHEVINTCWNRHDARPVLSKKRREVLRTAFWSLWSKHRIVENPYGRLSLSEVLEP